MKKSGQLELKQFYKKSVSRHEKLIETSDRFKTVSATKGASAPK